MIPARSFFMIRHGETVMNAERRACGWFETELNDQGRRQAFEASKVLGALPPELRPTLLIHSGMKRTIETANILNAEIKLPTLSDQDLREHNIGVWEGRPWDEIGHQLRAGTKPEGGESRTEFGTRICTAMAKHLADHASERLLFVTHGGLFHSFQFMQGQNRSLFIQNATLHRFDPEPLHQPMPWKVTLYEWKNALRESPAPLCPSQPYTPPK